MVLSTLERQLASLGNKSENLSDMQIDFLNSSSFRKHYQFRCSKYRKKDATFLWQLTSCLSLQLSRENLCFSTISPGFVKTPIEETVQLFGSMNNLKGEESISKLVRKGGLLEKKSLTKHLKQLLKYIICKHWI
jgi:hypothetical protein